MDSHWNDTFFRCLNIDRDGLKIGVEGTAGEMGKGEVTSPDEANPPMVVKTEEARKSILLIALMRQERSLSTRQICNLARVKIYANYEET